MRILQVDAGAGRRIDDHGSRGFKVRGLGLTAEAHLVVVHLAPGGVIGRHPAAGRQLLVVVEGDAQVSGDDGSSATIGPGQAAVWEPREQHETRSVDGLTALVVEGEIDLPDA